MAYILTLFLLISIFITGILWVFYCIRNIKNYYLNNNHSKNDCLYQENKIKINHQKYFLESLSTFFPIFLTIFKSANPSKVGCLPPRVAKRTASPTFG